MAGILRSACLMLICKGPRMLRHSRLIASCGVEPLRLLQ